jgi:hypothetical protein
MEELSFNDGVAIALDSLLNDRLAILVGAGLSMTAPSSLPSAATIAAQAKQKYDATYGTTRPPLADGVEQQAEFFFHRGELATVYFRTLIDQNAFAGPPNEGHYAAADLLLVRAVQTAVTTNVDTLVETAGQILFGQIGVGIEEAVVAALPPDIAPLLKVHGCRSIDAPNMVWAPGQLTAPPVSTRITSSANWLRVRLSDRDLLIIGYWTDWDYLNGVLATALAAVRPARVTVVNPAAADTFEEKAPELYKLGQGATGAFQRVDASGSAFLAALRLSFSKSFVRQVLHSGVQDYSDHTGAPPAEEITEPPDLDNDTLWQVRRDLEGCSPNQPALLRRPPAESLVGTTLLQLRAKGAVPDGPYWLLQGRRIRVLRALNQPLHRVQNAFARETAPVIAPDIVVAVGAEAQSLSPNVARAETAPTIARGTAGRWITRLDAIQEFDL